MYANTAVTSTAYRRDHRRVTIREADGKTYEFHANQDTLQTLKVGDRLEATLRTATAC